jgi:hypothetical protein
MDRAVLAEIIEALVAAPVVPPSLARWLVRWRSSGEGGEDTITPMLKAAIAAADGRKAKKLLALGVEAGVLSE